MNILFCGKTDFNYNRVRVLRTGLAKLENVEIRLQPIKKRKNYLKEGFTENEQWADVLYIPPFRHRDVSFIKKLSKKPLIFDPLISKYLTKAIDYGHWYKAPFKYWLDYIPFNKADLLLADTHAHLSYFKQKFSLKKVETNVLHIGADLEHFKIQKSKTSTETFKVGFYGSFVPLQGVETILKVAQLLLPETHILFTLLGTGYQYEAMKKIAHEQKLSNVHFAGWIDYAELPKSIAPFDVALGIFGDSLKADLVIPNKLFHYAAMGKCTITKETDAVKEIFAHDQNIWLTKNTPKALAENILKASLDRAKTKTLGENAHQLIRNNFSEITVAKKFVLMATGLL